MWGFNMKKSVKVIIVIVLFGLILSSCEKCPKEAVNRCTLTLSLDNLDTLINALTADAAAARLATETANAANPCLHRRPHHRRRSRCLRHPHRPLSRHRHRTCQNSQRVRGEVKEPKALVVKANASLRLLYDCISYYIYSEFILSYLHA